MSKIKPTPEILEFYKSLQAGRLDALRGTFLKDIPEQRRLIIASYGASFAFSYMIEKLENIYEIQSYKN